MAIKFFEWLINKTAKCTTVNVECADLFAAAREYAVRDLCFQACVNMIANAIGRCEFRTYRRGEEVRDREYYMLNIEPNTNHNGTDFWHKVIYQLYTTNEALIIPTRNRSGIEGLVCADSWQMEGGWPQKQNEYVGVQVGELTYSKTFRENDVLHLRLNAANIRPLLNALYQSYANMLDAAETYYTTRNGAHLKVHVSTIESQKHGFAEAFAEKLRKEVVPYLKGANGVLPEFDGYQYEVQDFGGGASSDETRKLIEDVFNMTAQAFGIPVVLVNGAVEGTADANRRFLTYAIDPLCDQIQEEINRKRYGYDAWSAGSYVRVDSSSIIHFDIFENAANIEKVVGSGIFSLNDVLRAANQEPIREEWADAHYMTLNISTMGEQTRRMEGGETG